MTGDRDKGQETGEPGIGGSGVDTPLRGRPQGGATERRANLPRIRTAKLGHVNPYVLACVLTSPRMKQCGLQIVVVLVLTSSLVGCYRKVSDPWSELRRFSDPVGSRDRKPDGQERQFAISGYAILLRAFEGNDRQARAQRYVDQLLRSTPLRDLWFTAVDDRTLVYRGRYGDPQHPDAQSDLNATQVVVIGEEQPFKNAAIVAIGLDADMAGGEHDLRRFPGKFSLQIGYYDAQLGSDHRAAAERAVEALRTDGEDAYYYHGPTMSMVTIGIFGLQDVQQRVHRDPNTGRDTIQPVYSQRVLEIQRRFPRNVANGRVNLLVGPDGQPRPSFLIRVPY